MSIFFLDLWHDLREKRLAPVAVVLAVALLAVPFVLREKKTEVPAAAPTAAATPGEDSAKNLAVKALQESEVASSDLGVFDPKNPFKPLRSAEKDPAGDGKAGVPESAKSPGSAGSTGGGGDAKVASGGGFGGGGEAPSGGGSTGGGDSGPAPRTKTVRYTYVVDLTFEREGRTRRIKGFQRLGMLPNREAPLLIFLGVDSKAANAVFMVDSSLEANGEGTCKPSAEDCALLYLGAGEEHFFTNAAGERLGLRVDEIRRVRVRSSRAASSRKKRRPAEKKSQTTDQQTERRRFLPPVLLDLVSVSSADARASNSGKRR